MAENGATVTVCDVKPALINQINAGTCPYEEPELDAYLERNVKAGRLDATTDTKAAAAKVDAVIVIVPALLTEAKEIDYATLLDASQAIGDGMKSGLLVCYETTVAVGGTRNVMIPALEEASGMRAGQDFSVAFSPERVKANRVFERLKTTPKVVGGVDAPSAERAGAMYAAYLGAEIVNVGSLEAAELTKLAGMLYRDVNIALANELAAYSERVGVDFAAVLEANKDHETHLLKPGIGVGGHCTPVYPYFVIQDAMRHHVPQKLSTAARAINDDQPRRNVERLEKAWSALKGRRVHVLGLGFRPNVKVSAMSPAFDLQKALEARGAVVSIEDPFYTDAELASAGFASAKVGVDALDAVILNTAHRAFEHPDFAAWRAAGVEAVVDGQRTWNPADVARAGILYLGVGRGETVAE